MGIMPDSALERLLDGCHKLGKIAETSGATQWEIVAGQDYGIQVEIENGKIALAAGGGEGGYGIRVVENGRYGYAYLARPDNGRSAVEQALDIARRSPQIDGFELVADSGSTSIEGMFDNNVDTLTVTDLLTSADDLLSITADLSQDAIVTGGGVGAGISAGAILTSEGIEDSGVKSSHSLGVQITIDKDDLLTSGWNSESKRHVITNPEGVVEHAIWWTEQCRKQISGGEVGDSPVILTDSALGGLFATIVPQATLGDRQARGESFWTNKMGQGVLAEHLSLIDDRTMTGGKDSGGRDAEGRATRKNVVVENGILKGALWSGRDAAEQVALGNVEFADSTASASRDSYEGPPFPSAANLSLCSSQRVIPRDGLIAEIVDGYLVGSVMGAHTANPTSGDFSVTSSHILKIEDGEVVGALRQAGISGNLPRSLAEEVALGDSPRPHGGWGGGSVYVPDVLFKQGIRVNPA